MPPTLAASGRELESRRGGRAESGGRMGRHRSRRSCAPAFRVDRFRGHAGHFDFQLFMLPQRIEGAQEFRCSRVAFAAEHMLQTLRRFVHQSGQFVEAVRRLDIFAQHAFAGADIAVQQAPDALQEHHLAQSGIARGLLLQEFLVTLILHDGSGILPLPFLVLVAAALGGFNVLLLPLFRAVSELGV